MIRVTTVVLLVAIGWGCASKKYVREKLAPVDERSTVADSRSSENAERLADLDAKMTEETARLESELKDGLATVSDEAKQAQASADRAMARADDAMARADSAHDGVGELEMALEALGDYQMAAERAILFGFDSAEMSDEAEGLLRDMMGDAQGEDFFVEVRGFTDSVGDPKYNLELSRRRAEAVVRNLHTEHSVPLRRIQRVGLGEEHPVDENSSRDGRMNNRRVEVRLFVPGGEQGVRVE